MFCNELSVDWDSKNISKLTKIVLDVLRLDIAGFTLKNDSDLFELGLESIGVVELLSDLEREMNILVDVEDVTGELFSKFENLIEFVKRKSIDA